MKKLVTALMVAALVAIGLLSFGAPANAEEVKFVGVITKIELAGKDATSGIATLKDNKTEALIPVVVSDELTLDKFKDNRIVEGDEIRCKYEVIDGKNVAKLFRKTAGC